MKAFCKVLNENGTGIDAVLSIMEPEALEGKYDTKTPTNSQNCSTPSEKPQ